MKDKVEQASRWIYGGVWAILVHAFRVPAVPPSLPTPAGEVAYSFRPSEGFLRYLKLWFWLALVWFDGLVLVGWIAITIASRTAGVLLAVPALVLAVLPDIVAYIAIHLRYDTTWYVMTSRSLRIRRGIWIIHETTITFENVQNIKISQGPVQRFFGIANVLVETAGGGGQAAAGAQGGGMAAGHRGLIEGVDQAQRIRDLILSRLRKSQSAGLGDEHDHEPHLGLSPAHLAVLREIRDLASQLAA